MKLIIPVVNGYEDIELITVVDVLRRAGIPVEIVGVTASMVEGKSKVKIMTDKRLQEVSLREYDGIILIGGPGYASLEKTAILNDYIKAFATQGKLLAAIGEGVAILAKNGLLDEKKAVIAPGMEKLLAYPRDQPVITDQNIITSQAPGTAMHFALAIVKKLKGDQAAQLLKKELVVV
ncbi:MAG: DJ-1/PfpI family protein [Candidatus Aenigmarchaeota archaeon]|nr:DJ-1/PfpI family protein [Candidatus Aenigmarchaeota archaeon]